MKRVVVHIDSLKLHGFRYEDRYDIAHGLQQELSRLLAEQPGSVERLTGLDGASRLRIPAASIVPGSTPRGIGSQLARGIGKGMPE